MVKKMLIDATHLEETRVVVVDGTRLDELDLETSTKKQLKGNIYLAKVARVEPSLQAAFVDNGGNRHAFLAFNEIHPDYYQIPVADREALKEAMMVEERDEDEDGEETKEQQPSKRQNRRRPRRGAKGEAPEASGETDESAQALASRSEDAPSIASAEEGLPGTDENADPDEDADDRTVETVSGSDADETVSRPRSHHLKRYKIQEVIHRGQVLLVQVTKEERGNKGAALTTYLSLAGRYCVLMPNNSRGGGVSRKITNAADRKRLKSVIADLPLPAGMSVIVRTAGKERTKLEIKRDYEYLIKTWVQVRDKTMESSAPSLIHEEGNLIKRALRDMYTRDIAEILIEGDAEYRMAKDFMKLLTPSHAKKVQQYKDDVPLFFRYQVESQLEAMHSNIVQLKSGAYLVMDQTEALVAIDVNSGRATKERNIEETALKTNLEAADEIARQLRLRDMAGLVVIDFIDMEEARNNHAVERRMKEALKRDRARVQMGRITGFGLMELSRQRLHSSFLETSYTPCPHCRGKGLIRSTESASIHTLHLLEEEGLKRRFSEVRLTVPTAVALYVLNQKRADLDKIEHSYGMKISIEGDDTLLSATDYRIERSVRTENPESPKTAVAAESETPAAAEEEKAAQKGSRRDRRSRRGGRNADAPHEEVVQMIEEPKDAEDSWVIQEDVITLEGDGEVIQADALFEEGLKASARPSHEERTEEGEGENGEHRSRRSRRGDRRFSKRRRSRDDRREEEAGSDNRSTAENAQEQAEAPVAAVSAGENTEAVVEAVVDGEVNGNRPHSPSHRRKMRPHSRPRPAKENAENGETAAPEQSGEKPEKRKSKAVVKKEEDKPVILYQSHPAVQEKAPKKAKAADKEPAEEKPSEAQPGQTGEKRKGWWQKLVK